MPERILETWCSSHVSLAYGKRAGSPRRPPRTPGVSTRIALHDSRNHAHPPGRPGRSRPRHRSAGAGGRWLILTHDNPDPDALAAAALLARLLRGAFRQKSRWPTVGWSAGPRTARWSRACGSPFATCATSSSASTTRFALVDTQPRTGNNQLPDTATPDLVIDHHPLRKATQGAAFHDVRPTYGATATWSPSTSGRRPGALPAPGDRSDLCHPLGDPGLRPRVVGARQGDLRPLLPARQPPPAGAHPEPAAAAHLLRQPARGARAPRVGRHPDRQPPGDDRAARHRPRDRRPPPAPRGKTWSLVTGIFGERLYLSIRTPTARPTPER